MTTTLTIKPNELEAIALAASDEASRYYLCGVCFEPNGGMIATDGNRLHLINTVEALPPGDSFIMSGEDVKKALSLAKAEAKITAKSMRDNITLCLNYAKPMITCKVMLGPIEKGSFTCHAVDGNFPNWRRIFPSDKKGEVSAIGLNALYVADFGKAAKLLGSKFGHIAMTFINADSAILITTPANAKFKGLLMPVRS